MDISRMLLIIKFLITSSILQNKLTRLFFDFGNSPELENFISVITNKTEENFNLTTINILIFTGSSFDTAEINTFPIYEPENIYQNIDAAKPTVMYIHAYNENPFNISIKAVIGAYLERGTDNVLLVDWTDLASKPYWQLLPKLKDISRVVTKTLDRLIELGLNLNTFHLIGFSLGAQVAGFIGKSSKHTLPHFTALDPAKPGFEQSITEYINNKSAKFVDVLHTDGDFYGNLEFIGTANFYPNGGVRPQPGCQFIPITENFCNHLRAAKLWAESIKHPQAFPATLCQSYLQFLKGDCDNNDVVYFGPLIPNNASGRYFFTTNLSTITNVY